MGNRLSTISSTGDLPHSLDSGPVKDVSFFHTIRTKWLEYFIAKLNENTLFDLKITNTSEMLQWKDYFHYFNEIKEFSTRDNEIKKRLTWHPATIGYMMEMEQGVVEVEEVIAGIPDDYTEDEAESDISDEDDDESENEEGESSKSEKRKRIGEEDEENSITKRC